MPTARSRFSHRHLLALGTFLVPLAILTALGWSELERSGELAQAAQQREGRQFLASARQAIEQRLDRYLSLLVEESQAQLLKQEPVRATLAINDQVQFAALRGIVLLDDQGGVLRPQLPSSAINLPLAEEPQRDNPLSDCVRGADLLLRQKRFGKAIELLEHVLAQLAIANPRDANDPSPRAQRPGLEETEKDARFLLATVLLKTRRIEDAKTQFEQVKGLLALQRSRSDPYGLTVDLALAELGTPADRLNLLRSIADSRLEAHSDGALTAAAIRLAATFPADDPERTEVDRLLRETRQLGTLRTLAADCDLPIKLMLWGRRTRHTEADDAVQRLVATIAEQPVLVCVRAAQPDETRKWNCASVALYLDLRAMLGPTWQQFSGGDSGFVLGVREDENTILGPPATVPGDWVPPTAETEGLTLLAYPADPARLAAEAASAAWMRPLLILFLSVTALGGALWSWRSVSRERELAALKIDLVSRVSHELKTPLALVRMYGETLGMGRARDGNQAAEFGSIIAREAGRLTTLINRILDFSRQQAGTLSYAPAPIDLGELLRSVAAAYTPHLEARGVILIDSLPLGITVACDANAAESAVVNLLENAAKYGRDDDVEHEVELVLERLGDTAVIEVRDRGRGIPPGEFDRVFDGFYRASNAGEVRGAGLGLSLVRHFARAHGGDIQAVARDGGGTVMRLVLPRAQTNRDIPSTSPDTVAPASSGPAPTP
ncbi:MAG: HAMP domain-containing sensor histidine kinase [Planctomycetota bacterium]